MGSNEPEVVLGGLDENATDDSDSESSAEHTEAEPSHEEENEEEKSKNGVENKNKPFQHLSRRIRRKMKKNKLLKDAFKIHDMSRCLGSTDARAWETNNVVNVTQNVNGTVLATSSNGVATKHQWLLDTCANVHTTPEADVLTKTKYPGGATISTQTGQAQAEIRSTVPLINSLSGIGFSLKVLHNPEFKHNILAWPLLKKQGWTVDQDFTKLYPPNSTSPDDFIPVKYRTSDGLPVVEIAPSSANEILATILTESRLKKLQEHRHCGHVPYNPDCDLCKKHMSQRAPHAKKVSEDYVKVEKFLDSVSCDLAGPFKPSISKAKYWAIFVDHHTRWVEIIPIASKNSMHTAEALAEFKTRNGVPRNLRLDNGKEFLGRFLTEVRKHDTTVRYTVPFCPQQNGLAESHNKSVANLCNLLLEEGGLGERYWSYNAQYAAYLINRNPKRYLDGKSPYEARFGRKPCLRHVVKLGTKCFFAREFTHKKYKGQSRNLEGIVLGCDPKRPGYFVQEKSSGKVYTGRGVKFTFDATEPSMVPELPEETPAVPAQSEAL